MSTIDARLAVLIDAENISATHADAIFVEVARLGRASVRRMYGDFSGNRHQAWISAAERHAILLQPFLPWPQKNAADIALVIDAMELAHAGDVDGVCLVTSDSDFTRLAVRLREKGIAVYGFGEPKAARVFRNACERFFHFNNVNPSPGAPVQSRDFVAERDLISAAMNQGLDKDGWISLSVLGIMLRKARPAFDNGGFATLSKLLDAIGLYEVDKSGTHRMRLRARIRAQLQETRGLPLQ